MEFFAAVPDDFPEDHPLRTILAQHADAQNRHEMSVQARKDQVKAFFDELTIDQLVTLNMLLRDIDLLASRTSTEAALSLISYLHGKTSAILEHVHGVCPGCGKDHVAEDLEKALDEEATTGGEEQE